MTRWIHLRGVSVDYEDGYNHGAAALAGLMGMAEAVRDRHWKCDGCGGYNPMAIEVCDDCGLAE